MAPDFDAYRAKSKEVWELVGSTLGRPLQQVFLDEAYAEVRAGSAPYRDS